MLPVTVSPGVQVPAAVAVVATGNVISQATIGRLPITTVGASIAAQESYNQRQGGANARFAVAAELIAPQPSAASLTLSSPPGMSSQFGFSSPFLAQLLGQSSNAASVSAFYSDIHLPLDSQTWENYSLVRYKPSDAALPPPPSPREKVSIEPPPKPVFVTPPAPAEALPPEPAATLPATVPAQTTAIAAPRLPFTPAAPAASEPSPAPTARRGTVNARGSEAYASTAVRNEDHSAEPPAQVAVSL